MNRSDSASSDSGPLDLFVVLDIGTGDYWFWPGWNGVQDWLRLENLPAQTTLPG